MKFTLISLLFVSVVSYAGFRASAPPTVGGVGGVGDFLKDGTVAMTGDLTINAQKDARFADSDSTNYAAIQAPATITSNYTLTLPTTDGDANQVLQTNGSGVLVWANQGVYPTAWATCTATASFATNAVTTCKYRCSGLNTIDISFGVTLSGATDATSLWFIMPSSPAMTINRTDLALSGDYKMALGQGNALDVGTKQWPGLGVSGNNNTDIYMYEASAATQISNTVPFTGGSGDTYALRITSLPINETCN